VRVIAGSARGRRLVAPAGTTTRPTADRVREATFNALGSLGAVEDATVLDLFAGSGALGIEALSRGAAHATFVDDDRAATRAIEANLATTGLDERATVLTRSAASVLADASRAGRRWDLALLDPPYVFADWPTLLADLPAAVAVVESGTEVELPPEWRAIRQRRYGATLVTILCSPSPDPSGGIANSE
jgi:16S rRNA (guanine966-N2)-methyltransferase